MTNSVFTSFVVLAFIICLHMQAEAQTTTCEQQGGECVFKGIGAQVPCRNRAEGLCGSDSYYCCNKPAASRCQDLNGVCRHPASQRPCRRKLQAVCSLRNYHCCR